VEPPKSGQARRRERNRLANPVGDPLFEALRKLRRELAADARLPPYVIFNDATLREMAAVRPSTPAELGEVNGVGSRKLEAYGEAFLAVIRRH
jgi:ATP-dependent DNA helicase RecQ